MPRAHSVDRVGQVLARSCTLELPLGALAEIPSRKHRQAEGTGRLPPEGAWVPHVCSTRSVVDAACPIFSSIHMRPPPAPQQKPTLVMALNLDELGTRLGFDDPRGGS